MYPEDVTSIELELFFRNIAKKVKIIRKLKKISQLELALSIGHKSMSTIGKIEAGLENKHYNLEQLYRIAKRLDVDIKIFFEPIIETIE